MIAFIFLLYFITAVQILLNKPYKYFNVQITVQIIIIFLIDLMWLKHHMTDALNLHF